MATKTATKPKAAPAKRLPAAAGKKSATSTGIGDLASLALAAKEMEAVERAKTGSQNSFITLVKATSSILDKNDPNHIKGVKALDYAISSKKLGLGKALDVTILGMFKLYAEVTPKEKDSDMPKTVRFWMPEDAAQYPVAGIFDRPLPNGNALQPNHWVFVYLHDHPEIEDGLIAFRSKGNSIYAQLEKLVKAESSVCTELRFSVTSQAVRNEAYKKNDYYPKFEITGHNYKLTDGNKVVKTKDSKVDTATLKEIIGRSYKIQKAYQEMKMVAKQGALPAPSGRAALPAPKGGYADEDDADEAVSF